MKHFLISIGLIIYTSALVNCHDLNYENICEEATFNLDNGLKVNAISRHQFNVTFDDQYQYFMTYHDLNKIFKTDDKLKEAIEIRESFNKKMNEIYSENSYLNDPKLIKNVGNDLALIEEFWKKTNNLQKYARRDMDLLIRLYMLGSASYAKRLLISLDKTAKNKFELNGQNFKILIDEIRYLKYMISEQNLNHLKYALEDVSVYEIFVNYELIQINKFVFNLDEKYRNRSKGTLSIDLMLPIHNKNYNFEKNKGCIKSDRLPLYYQNKN